MTVHAATTLEVAWSDQLSGVFRFGYSTIGGTDVLGAGFGHNVFDTVSTVKRISISRGRDPETGSMQQGRAQVTVSDTNGTYNPHNPTSSLAGYLRPMRPARIRQAYGGITYQRFYGFVTKIEHDPAPGVQESYFELVDFFEWLGTQYPSIAATGATTVGAAIGKVLDAVEWTDPSLRSLGTGRSCATFSADGSESALELITALVAYDRGAFYVAGSGAVTFQAGETRWRRTAAVASLGGSLIGSARPAVDVAQIVNRQSVTKTGGTEQTATDDTSRRRYGYRDGSAITSPYLANDAEALSLARFIVATQKDGRPPVRGVSLINRDETALLQQLQREIGDFVTVSEGRGGTSYSGTIEGIREEISDGGLVQRTTFLIPEKRVTVFTIGQSTFGSTDIFGW